jgi:hypothetical protein
MNLKPNIFRLISFAVILIASFTSSNAQWYYPFQAGNRWEYWDAYPPPPAYLWTTRCVGDTLLPVVGTYRILRSDGGMGTGFERRVGSIVYVYDPYSAKERILYDFSKSVGDTVAITNTGSDTIITTVTYEYYIQIWGRSLKLKEFYERSLMSSMYVIRSVVDSIGLYRMTWEPGYGGQAVGAIIDGIQYGIITGVKEKPGDAPKLPFLEQNYPNPFNPSTTISYQLPTQGYVKLKVFDVLGQEVTTLVNAEQPAGYKAVIWDAVNVSNGIYFYRLQAGSYTETRKLVILR